VNNLTDIADENKKQWKSINALTAEVSVTNRAGGSL